MAKNSQYTGLGVALGAACGAALGVMAGNVAIWLAVGVAIGVAIGSSIRKKGIDCPACAAVHQSHETRERDNNLITN